MPLFKDLLPVKRMAAVASHAKTKEFADKVKTSVLRVKKMAQHPGVNSQKPITVWSSFGKDSMASILLCEMAGIDYQIRSIQADLDHPLHNTCIDELFAFNKSLEAKTEFYFTDQRGIDILADCIDAVNDDYEARGVNKKEDFWNCPIAIKDFEYQLSVFHHDEIDDEDNTLFFFGTRASESQGRTWDFEKNGYLYQPSWSLKNNQIPVWRGLPIADWHNLDVCAFLHLMGCPVSPVYGMNAIGQCGRGKTYWARTLHYCAPFVFGLQFAKWLKMYSPAQLEECLTYFPEILAKIEQGMK